MPSDKNINLAHTLLILQAKSADMATINHVVNLKPHNQKEEPMNKKILSIGMALGMATSLGLAKVSHAWLIDTNATVNTNSQNEGNSRNDNSLHLGDRSSFFSNSDSNNRYDYSRYDNRQDRSVRNTDSFNTDNRNFSDNRRDNSIKDAFNDYGDHSNRSVDNSVDASSHEAIGGDKRENSNNIAVSGDVRSSVLGNFNQVYSGTDLRSGVNGGGNTIDARSVNIATFGDTMVSEK